MKITPRPGILKPAAALAAVAATQAACVGTISFASIGALEYDASDSAVLALARAHVSLAAPPDQGPPLEPDVFGEENRQRDKDQARARQEAENTVLRRRIEDAILRIGPQAVTVLLASQDAAYLPLVQESVQPANASWLTAELKRRCTLPPQSPDPAEQQAMIRACIGWGAALYPVDPDGALQAFRHMLAWVPRRPAENDMFLTFNTFLRDTAPPLILEAIGRTRDTGALELLRSELQVPEMIFASRARRQGARAGLGAMGGPEAATVLLQFALDPENHEFERLDAWQHLHMNGGAGIEAPLARIQAELESPSPAIRFLAAAFLGRRGDASGREVLEGLLSEPQVPGIRDALCPIMDARLFAKATEMLLSKRAYIRARAAHLLSCLDTPAARKALIGALSDPDAMVVFHAAQQLAAFPTPAGLDAVLAALRNPSANRPALARALGTWPGGERALAAACELLRDADHATVAAAAEALRSATAPGAACLQDATGAGPGIEAAAAHQLAVRLDRGAGETALRYLRSPYRDTRRGAALALARLALRNPTSAPAAPTADPDAATQALLELAAAARGGTTDAALKRILEHPSWRARSAIVPLVPDLPPAAQEMARAALRSDRYLPLRGAPGL